MCSLISPFLTALIDNFPAKKTPAQHNTAFADWQLEHGDDPDAVAGILEEHAKIVATTNIASKPTDIPKRVTLIAQQMAEMVRINYHILHLPH